jgi:hypothetical protein
VNVTNPDASSGGEPLQPKEVTIDLLTKVGDHSVVSACMTSELLINETSTQQASPNFIRHFSSAIRDSAAQILEQNESISVSSFLSQSSPGGGTRRPQAIAGRVFPYHIGRIPEDNRHTLNVHFQAALEIGSFTKAPLEKLYNTGVPSERFIVSALQPIMRVVNVNLLHNISGCIEQNWQIYNNEALYAKLAYAAIVRDCYTFINTMPVAIPFPHAFEPIWLNLDAAEPNINAYLTLCRP